LALIASDLGFKDAAQRMLSQLAESGFAFPADAKRSTTLAYLAEVCASVRYQAHAERLYELLLPYRDLTITAGIATACYGSAGRHLGLRRCHRCVGSGGGPFRGGAGHEPRLAGLALARSYPV
jgi:hypothetical protein